MFKALWFGAKILTECFLIALIFFIPVFAAIWLFSSFKVAAHYSAIVAMVISLLISFLGRSAMEATTEINGANNVSGVNKKKFHGALALASSIVLITYSVLNPIPVPRYTITPIVKSDTKQAIIAPNYSSNRASSCGVLREQYHRVARKALRGEYVSPAEDIELPAHCRN